MREVTTITTDKEIILQLLCPPSLPVALQNSAAIGSSITRNDRRRQQSATDLAIAFVDLRPDIDLVCAAVVGSFFGRYFQFIRLFGPPGIGGASSVYQRTLATVLQIRIV